MAMTCPCRGHNPGSIPGVGVLTTCWELVGGLPKKVKNVDFLRDLWFINQLLIKF